MYSSPSPVGPEIVACLNKRWSGNTEVFHLCTAEQLTDQVFGSIKNLVRVTNCAHHHWNDCLLYGIDKVWDVSSVSEEINVGTSKDTKHSYISRMYPVNGKGKDENGNDVWYKLTNPD